MSDFGSVFVYSNFGFRNTRKMESERSHNRLKVVVKNNDSSGTKRSITEGKSYSN